MKPAVVYHWWHDPIKDIHVYNNLRVPLIISIATLRGSDPNIPIYVLNGSDVNVSWLDFPEKLNFKVVPYSFCLGDYRDRPGWNLLSRLNDVADFSKQIEEDLIIYSDCDVFWLNSPFPVEQNPDKFCFDRYNSGFFYFDKRSANTQKFFELFKAYVLTALNDENFRVITRQYASEDSWTYVLDETILYYMSCKLDNIFNIVGPYEHLAPWTQAEIMRVIDFDKIRMMHIHGTSVKNELEHDYERHNHARGLSCILIKEFYERIIKVLKEDDLKLIFGSALDHYLPKQASLRDSDFIERWLLTKKSKGELYQLNEAV